MGYLWNNNEYFIEHAFDEFMFITRVNMIKNVRVLDSLIYIVELFFYKLCGYKKM